MPAAGSGPFLSGGGLAAVALTLAYVGCRVPLAVVGAAVELAAGPGASSAFRRPGLAVAKAGRQSSNSAVAQRR